MNSFSRKKGPDFRDSDTIMKEPPKREPLRFHFKGREDSLLEKSLKFLFLFYVASFGGWVWEVILFAVKDGAFVNRGFLYGPWLPIYGIGSIVLLFFLGHWRKKWALVFILSALGGGALEFATGFFLDYFYGLRYWDYSGIPLNIMGYTCLYFMLAFGVIGTFWVSFLSHKLTGAWVQLTEHARHIILGTVSFFFALDCIISIFWPNMGPGITS